MQDVAVPGSTSACITFERYDFYENLRSLWSHVSQHQDKDFETRNEVSIEALKNALYRNRTLLEELSMKIPTRSIRPHALQSFYGDKFFKCPRLTCFYFHEGFRDSKSRDTHIRGHDRPFRCTFSDCSLVDFGFVNSKDLEKHMRLYHPDATQFANVFPKTDKVVSGTRWSCNVCGKELTRGSIHRSHMLSHSGERPFACPECGKAFTRANDCKRHQKIHTRRR